MYRGAQHLEKIHSGRVMSLLSEVYAGKGDEVLIDSLELSCPAWPESIYLCDGFEDLELGVPEYGGARLFSASAIDVDDPKRDNRGSQTLDFIIDGVLGEHHKLMTIAREARAKVTVKYRLYLSSDLTKPASNTLTAEVKSTQINGAEVRVTAGFFDVLSRNFNRITYDSSTAPALMYE